MLRLRSACFVKKLRKDSVLDRISLGDNHSTFVLAMNETDLIDLTWGPELIILACFMLGLLIQLSLYLIRFLPLALHKRKEADADLLPSVSIVICARNEEENLKAFLPAILAQDYPHFEVVVVNDCSWDNSYDYLKELAVKHPQLKLADIKEVEGREHGKKFALTIGIKAASHDILVLTDADCMPQSDQWIRGMMAGYTEGKYIVLGYGAYEKAPGFLNSMIRFDAFYIACTYLGMALRGNPYMGVGRNLSYHRGLFFSVRGFASHMHIDSGDDDLFINEVATAKNVDVVAHVDTRTVSIPRKSWKSWLRQKKRHHTTARHYRGIHKQLLLLDPISFYFLFFAMVAGCVLQYNLLILISGYLIRACLQIVILHIIGGKLGDKDLGWKAPVLEIFHRIFLYPIFALSILFVRKSKWN